MKSNNITYLLLISASVLLCAGLTVLYHYTPQEDAPHYNAQQLTHRAEQQGYGYKTANLMELCTFIDSLKNVSTKVAIPEFVGISSNEIITLLRTGGLTLNKEWKKLRKKYFKTKATRKKIMASKVFPKKYIQDLHKLKKKITKAFAKLTSINTALPETGKFLQLSKKNKWQLMVRSTGKEDTDMLANAGGNHTESNVAPQQPLVIQAIGKVVSSYFSKKSLQQRLHAADTTVFDMPITPVLIQRMIGEKIAMPHTKLPVGCVAYSQETEGNTPSVTTIQSSYGHNEGVVENTVPVDTYYVWQSKHIYKIIKNKKHRMVPVIMQKQKLAIKSNPKDIQSLSSLSDNTIYAIDTILQKIQHYYGKPMDLELVYQPIENCLYIVQARPIVQAKAEQPSYLETTKNCCVLTGSTVCSSGGKALHITNKNQILTRHTLNDALNSFNEMPEKNIKAVIVQQEAEATSHAAAVFRGEGIIVMKLQSALNYAKLEQWLQTDDVSIYLDPQQSIIAKPDNTQALTIQPGWSNHPLPQQLSIESVIKIAEPKNLHDHFPGTSYKELLQLLKVVDIETGKYALTSLLKKMQNQYVEIASAQTEYCINNPYLSNLAKQSSTKLNFVLQTIYQIAQNIIQTLHLPPKNITRLFHINFLEAALTQAQTNEVVNDTSFKNITQHFHTTVQFYTHNIKPLIAKGSISSQLLANSKLMHYAHQGYLAALNEHIGKQWIIFLDRFNQYGTRLQHNQFYSMMQNITKNKLLTGLINTSFNAIIATWDSFPPRTSTMQCFNKLKQEYNHVEELLTKFHEHTTFFATTKPVLWQQPKTVPTQLQKLTTHVLSFFMTKEFKKMLKQASSNNNTLQKIVLSSMLLQTTERFDLLIKTIKSSTLYNNIEAKNIHLKSALCLYLDLLKQVNPEKRLINSLEHALHSADTKSKEQLINSKRFRVGSIVCFENMCLQRDLRARQREINKLVTTLEDVFTSIHQLLLIKISHYVVQEWGLEKITATPQIMKDTEKTLELKQDLTGMRFDNNGITFLYNKSLRAHSVGLDIAYNTTEKNLSITTNFYGDNEYARWNIIKDYVRAASQLKNLPLSGVNQHQHGLSFSWKITTSKDNQELKQCLDNSITATFRLGIENKEKMVLKVSKTLDEMTQHLVTLAGDTTTLQETFLTNYKKSQNINLLSLPLLPNLELSDKQHTKFVCDIAQEAIENTTLEHIDALPINFYIYQQLQMLTQQPVPTNSTTLNKYFVFLDKRNRSMERRLSDTD